MSQDDTALSINATFANQVMFTPFEGGMRLTFAEQNGAEGALLPRAAVFVPTGTLLAIHKVISDMIEAQAAAKAAVVKKPAARRKGTRH